MIIKTNNNKRKRLKVSCLIFLTSLLLIDSCSHKNIDTKTVAPKPYNKKIDKLISGPTKKPVINQFIDQTELYGLRNIKATNLYAVDFNHDSFTDLVVLPEHFSIPDFYQFEGNSNKFIKLDYNPLPEVIRGSYLSFVDFNKDGILDLVVGTLNLKTELTKYLKKNSKKFVTSKAFINIDDEENKGKLEKLTKKDFEAKLAIDLLQYFKNQQNTRKNR